MLGIRLGVGRSRNRAAHGPVSASASGYGQADRPAVIDTLANAASIAVFLSANVIGIMSATSTAPKMSPAMIPKTILFTTSFQLEDG